MNCYRTEPTDTGSYRKHVNEQAAKKKMVSVLFLSLEIAGRKNLTDEFPHRRIPTVSFREIQEICEQAIQEPRNRTLKRYKFFS